MRNKMEEFLLKPFGDAKAGYYKPSLRGLVRDFVFPHNIITKKTQSLIDVETIVLDISFYQDTADFQIMKSAGARGVIIRAGQNAWKDVRADEFMILAKQAEMPFGSYWFYDSRIEPERQAELWAKILADDDTKLGIWADYEENYGGAYGGWRKFYNFLEACKRLMPERMLGIYTGYYYWLEHSPNPITESASLNYFAQYPLWLAWYTTNPSIVKIPKPWTKMVFWQYSASGDGANYGVGSKEVDKNKFMGTYDEYKTMFNLEEDNGGTDPMPEVNWIGKVKDWVTLGAVVRDAPNGSPTGNKILGGTAVEATGEPVQAGIYSWRNVVKPYQGWVADHLLEGNYVSQPTTLPDTLYIGTKPDGSDLEKYIKEV